MKSVLFISSGEKIAKMQVCIYDEIKSLRIINTYANNNIKQ